MYVFILQLTPYPCAFFFRPALRFSFLSSILYQSSSLSLPGVERKTSTVPSCHLTPLTFYLSAIIWYLTGRTGWEGGGGRGGEKRGGGSREEGWKNVKIWKGGEKRIFLRVPLREGRGETRAGGVRPTLLSTLSYLKTKATIHLVLNIPHTHTHTPSGLKPALKNV